MAFFSLYPPTLPGSGSPDNGNSIPAEQLTSSVLSATVTPKVTPTPSARAAALAAAIAAAKKKVAEASKAKVLGNSSAGGGGRSAAGRIYGIAGGLASLPTAALNAQLDDMKAMGVGWVRYDIEWSNIQYDGPGSYNWGDYDRMVQAVSAHGINALAVIDYTPEWARRSDCRDSAMCAPADPVAYGRFAAAAAARYKGYGVRTWEIWNEPNSQVFFQPGADVGLYTAMLKSAYVAIKGVDGGATVLTGGTAPGDTGGGWMSPPDFVNGIYANGGKGYFDALAHHPYTWPYSAAYRMPGNAWDQLGTLHAIMTARGDGAKKIWITEYGAPTGGPGPLASSGYTTAEGAADHVTDALEARMVTDAVNTAASLSWVGGFFWYSYRDSGTASDTVENFFGLLRADGSRKPAYAAYKAAIAAH